MTIAIDHGKPSIRAALGAAILLLGATASADPIPLNFGGVVDGTLGLVPQQVGDALLLTLALDPNRLTITEDDPTGRRYNGLMPVTLAFTRGGNEVLRYDLPNGMIDLVINNDFPDDRFALAIGANFGLQTFGVDFILDDPTATALSSFDLPTNLNLNAFDGPPNSRVFTGGYVTTSGGNLIGAFSGPITSLNGVEASPTPEPATVILVASGLAAAGIRRCRRRRKSSSRGRCEAFAQPYGATLERASPLYSDNLRR